MSAIPAVPASGRSSHIGGDATSAEQAYVDWAYERLASELSAVAGRENVGINRQASFALSEMKKERLGRIRAALENPNGLVRGRLDLLENETYYIGLHTVYSDGGRPTVVEWQTDMGKRFYQATTTFPAGIGRRRTIAMSKRRVTGVSDETLTPGFNLVSEELKVAPAPVRVQRRLPSPDVEPPQPVAAEVESPQAEIAIVPALDQHVFPGPIEPAAKDPAGDEEVRAADLLLEELQRQRTGALEEVVATIQADQDRLIRSPIEVPLIIQGGPGTGKTIVGLHRAAWVIYEQRRRLIDQSVLVVGPNRRFMAYISSVLPSLGETDIRQVTIDELSVDNLSATDRSRVRVKSTDDREVGHLKGDPRMAVVVRAAVWAGVKPLSLTLPYGRFTLRLSADRVDSLIGQALQRSEFYKAARREMTDLVISAFVEEYGRRAGGSGRASESRGVASAARAELTKSKVIDRMFPKVEPRQVVQKLLEDRRFLDRVATQLHPDERALLNRRPVKPFGSSWTAADLPLLDEAAAQIGGPPPISGHVVVDEAQDLSPMQWRVLSRRSSQGSMTVLGDLGQATSTWSAPSWREVAKRAFIALKAEVAELRLGYRVPRQVMDFAAPLLDVAAPGVRAPRSFRTTKQPVVRLTARDAVPATAVRLAAERSTAGAVAIIAAAEHQEALTRAVAGLPGPSVPVLTPDGAKGLEFDVVVVVEPTVIAGRSYAGLRQLYVALTRPTNELIVVHSRVLPAGIGQSHRPPVPSTYPNPRNDDPWDNDTVHWLLEQPGGEDWTRGVLMESLRRQPGQVERNPQRVTDAARFAKRNGVVQIGARRGAATITRLLRTDEGAPEYPASEEARRATRKPAGLECE